MVVKKELTEQQRDYILWLKQIEKGAIIPLKWIILFTTLLIWVWGTSWVLPSPGVFTLFLLYAMFNFALSYFFYFNRLDVTQVKSVCLVSYAVDIMFITSLVYADIGFHYGTAVQSDFYVLYFLLILRGFALFQTATENMVMSALIALLFLITLSLQDPTIGFFAQQGIVLKFILIWMVALMSWFIVESINRQKAELLRIREKLMNSQHLSHLGEIAANMAHEINNPIGIIAAYSEYLIKDSPEDDPHREDYATIRREALRCEKIMGGLLDYARPAARTIINCRLEEINDDVIALIFRKSQTPHVTVTRQYDNNLPELLADREQLKQALVNIYLNAREAMDGKGTINSEVRLIPAREHSTGQEHVEITIRDSGKGFSRDTLRRAFDPFFSGRKGGTGLGLTITEQIVHAHNGEIALRNHPLGGAEVKILLPFNPIIENSRESSNT